MTARPFASAAEAAAAAAASPAGPPPLTRALALSPGFGARAGVAPPPPDLLDLPVRAVQFGTGAFLRGFVDHFVDAANRAGTFGGRIVAVGSTGSGRDRALDAQDGLYTLVSRGLEGGEVREDVRVIGSLAGALSAVGEWDAVLACARAPELELVFSNTTEVGIVLDDEDVPEPGPPRSFPGKLARFLRERAAAFDHDPERGVVVVPCELIERNGDQLREIVLALGARWGYGAAFDRWVRDAVPFCNTLVDRIVPGAPAPAERARLEEALGYADAMLTTCETYRLFAIECDEAVRPRLRFAGADPGIILTSDVAPYRERKLRLLNGTHTAFVPAAILCGFETVREAVADPTFGRFVRRILFDEIAPTVDAPGTAAFADEVLDRFSNPFIHHALIDITLQGVMKTRVRNVPTIERHAARAGTAPPALTFGFAANLLFLRGDVHDDRRRRGLPVPADGQADRVRALWTEAAAGDADPDDAALAALARRTAADATLWGADLTRIPGFADAVAHYLARMLRDGPAAALRSLVDGGAPPADRAPAV